MHHVLHCVLRYTRAGRLLLTCIMHDPSALLALRLISPPCSLMNASLASLPTQLSAAGCE